MSTPLYPYRSTRTDHLDWARTSLVSSLALIPFAIRCRRNPRVLTSGFSFLLLYTEFRYIFSEHIFPKHFCKHACHIPGSPFPFPLKLFIYIFYTHFFIYFIIMLSGGYKILTSDNCNIIASCRNNYAPRIEFVMRILRCLSVKNMFGI